MSEAPLQAYTTEEAEKGHSMRPDEKDKYLRIVELGNKMLRDAVPTRRHRERERASERERQGEIDNMLRALT